MARSAHINDQVLFSEIAGLIVPAILVVSETISSATQLMTFVNIEKNKGNGSKR